MLSARTVPVTTPVTTFEVVIMEIRVLEYFLAVAREESISHAAESLHLTQPTLSRQLKDLEEELGKTLFTRGKKITLTDDGILLRKRAEEIVDLVHKTKKEVKQNDDIIAGDIYIGAGETRGMKLIFEAAKKMQETYPDVRFHISSGDATDCTDRLIKGLDDFILFMGSVDDIRFESIEIPFYDQWGVLIRQDDPLAKKTSVKAKDLKNRKLIMSRRIKSGSQVADCFGKFFTSLDIIGTYNLSYNASLMAEQGMGVVLSLDGLIFTSDETPLAFRPLEPKLSMKMSFAWKKDTVLSPAAEKFLEIVNKVII